MSTKEYSTEGQIGSTLWNLSTGKFAMQANGSVVVRAGDTMVMGTVVLGRQREGIDYLPLMVDYEEKLYAAGKIKGSRWVKREGRPSDDAILRGRVIDRSIRPMFSDNIRNDIQVVVTVLSVDGANDPDILGLNAASAAIEVSNIPWDGPIAGVRVGKIDGKLVLNPSYAEAEAGSSLDLIVSGTENHIIMVESGAFELPEAEMIEAIAFAQKEIKNIVGLIKKLAKDAGTPKVEIATFAPNPELIEKFSAFKGELEDAIYKQDKAERDQAMNAVREKAQITLAGDDSALKKEIGYIFDKKTKEIIQGGILESGKRVDGRALDEIRTITCEVGILPRVHGTGLFKRGETQVLTTATLGGPDDVQLLEDLDTEEERHKRYMHHYNFPGYSVGEVQPLRSPGRREIGHGALAERALEPMLPKKEDFPYTIRLVSEVLSSNGSTSMGSTCGSTLALMDAGVPIKAPVSGIAMGLVLDIASGNFKILSDIQGIEDGNGHMDFKVAGTKDGITALQLDIKVKGLTVEILKSALEQAKAGRMFILEKMLAAIPEVRPEMSIYAPRITSFHINPEKIREVIGPGGKIINNIIAETGVKIDIEDDGLVMVTSNNAEGSAKAVDWIKNLVREVMPGEIFEGKVVKILDFGAFVEILPGQDGMIHISELENHRVDKVTDVVNIGDTVKVKVIAVDDMGRINLSRKALLPGASDNAQNYDRPRPPRRDDRGPRGSRPPHGGKPNLDHFIAKP
ncbi:MAG: polyribonucleotide nucleotidyltransferase [Candidatus Doudnabacteria bacterium RIFCSPHIGHO2_01_FULL_46_14]|uniref:Polyribonucleotide nucleotidyltransferase n=1 Tax=Candidatus Doudnabacteria bacterium RIFCSPHIGHO2_01_FULL_46_14 TaxID=1817824 RepID=A0A1F5NL35_9BACT|nr:MAG: polyribonucleotide nucleotidyltransferase [Candidatus Doudnabacteria bacterium RIFCSPHIGHO2_01_FULL_46_14]